jgi:hypothetical protein
LIEALAVRAKNAGIHRWKGVFFSSHTATRKLLTRIGTPESEIVIGANVVECIYRLRPRGCAGGRSWEPFLGCMPGRGSRGEATSF